MYGTQLGDLHASLRALTPNDVFTGPEPQIRRSGERGITDQVCPLNLRAPKYLNWRRRAQRVSRAQALMKFVNSQGRPGIGVRDGGLYNRM